MIRDERQEVLTIDAKDQRVGLFEPPNAKLKISATKETVMPLYYAAKSNTDGMGLFAKEFIPKGTIWWRGSRNDFISITQHNYELLVKSSPSAMLDEIHNHTYYVQELNQLLYICNDGRYINHSENPNCAAVDFAVSITLRDIDKDEELFEDYRTYDRCPWANLWGEFGKQLGVWNNGY